MSKKPFIQAASVAFLAPLGWDLDKAISYAERLWQRLSERGYGELHGATPGEGAEKVEVVSPRVTRATKKPAETAETWAAYAAAYRERYRVEPVRNGRGNRLLAEFVRRLGQVEAPQVAAFFVRHPGAYYSIRMHAIDCLLTDAEKLRTEWAAGTVVTAAKARQDERTSATLQNAQELLRELEGGTP